MCHSAVPASPHAAPIPLLLPETCQVGWQLHAVGQTDDATISGTTTSTDGKRRLIAKKGGRKDGDWAQRLRLGAGSWGATEKQEVSIEHSNSQLTYDEPDDLAANLSPDERAALVEELRDAMNKAAKDLDFEEAARLRDRLHELERWNG